MKNTNTTQKTFKRSLYILLAGMFATSISTQAADLLEVEKVSPITIMVEIEMPLNILDTKAQTQLLAQSMLSKEAELITRNSSSMLAKTTIIAE